MKLLLSALDGNDYEVKATVTTDHAQSSYGQPVVVLEDGSLLDHGTAMLLQARVRNVADEEKDLLETWRSNCPREAADMFRRISTP